MIAKLTMLAKHSGHVAFVVFELFAKALPS
jgi:hypothetical protein